MTIDLYQIDAFTNTLFGGNPAAVCPLEQWPEDETLLNIAKENNLAETAYFSQLKNGNFKLRWFTPEIEMDLCGHATLASAYVLFYCLNYDKEVILFETKSGVLKVKKIANFLEMELPARPAIKTTLHPVIETGLNIQPMAVFKARDYLLVYPNEETIKKIRPNIQVLNQINLDPGGIIVTAQGDTVDFVSRFFTPNASIFEDPVTGSAHATLVPFWAEQLAKNTLTALQISERKGELLCRIDGDRVFIKGQAVKYLQGKIDIA